MQPNTTPAPPWIRNAVIGGITIFGILLLIVISVDWDAMTKPQFAWQKRCGAACGRKLGMTTLKGIETATSCITLQAMKEGACRPERCSEYRAALQDQMDYRHCPGSAPRTAADPYQPSYSWQKRCGEDCANILGYEEMTQIDRYDCRRLQELLPYARNPKLWSDYDQNYDIYAEESKAILDKYESLHCK